MIPRSNPGSRGPCNRRRRTLQPMIVSGKRCRNTVSKGAWIHRSLTGSQKQLLPTAPRT